MSDFAAITDVLAGSRRWGCVPMDAIRFLMRLPDDSVDLLFTSPPYELARTYGIGGQMIGGEAWVQWMMELVTIAAPKVKGLIAINCEGQTRDFSYSGVPFLLFADLKRKGFNMRKPVVFHRVGIPGSGGPDWLRNDWEPIICVTRNGKLPWSDNTACGHAPKWAPGGEMSHRLSDGTRTNQWGKTGTEAGVNGSAQRTRDGERQKASRPSHKMTSNRNAFGVSDTTTRRRTGNDKVEVQGKPRKVITKPRDGMHNQEQDYSPPAIANPGNVIKCTVGGGQMGSTLASENEAPFPLDFASFFVKSFCPPDGVVCDPFGGSGTTCHAAFENGRRFVGCDVRESQVEVCKRRMATVTPSLFAGSS